MKFRILFVLTWAFILSAAEQKPLGDYQPWYTGPILAIATENVAPGKVNINPYLAVTDTYGQYNNHWHSKKTSDFIQTNQLWLIEFGINNVFDILIQPSVFYNEKSGKHYFGFDNFSGRINFQILNQKEGTAQPSLRLMIRQNFPTAKYDQFDPDKSSVESIGSGAYETVIGLLSGKIVYWLKAHPIRWRLNATYSFPTTVHVEGFNYYGGGYNTYGKVRPGNVFTFLVSCEFSLTQRWVLASDFQYQHTRKTSFYGQPGQDLAGNTASIGSASSDSFVISPALEYNFTQDLGIYGGAVFVISGRNADNYIQPNLAVTYTF